LGFLNLDFNKPKGTRQANAQRVVATGSSTAEIEGGCPAVYLSMLNREKDLQVVQWEGRLKGFELSIVGQDGDNATV
jgi:hypothetical protein